jgi:hypothetical protein
MGRRNKRDSEKRRRRKTGGRKPKWLLTATDLDHIAQRRCLMILSVLSGEKSVEEASKDGEVMPAQYYQWEKKALDGMLSALVPGAMEKGTALPALRQMEERIAALEATKRRLERLLSLTRMTLKSGPMTQGSRGRPRIALPSEDDGPKRSPSLPKSSRRRRTTTKTEASPSPTASGEVVP